VATGILCQIAWRRSGQGPCARARKDALLSWKARTGGRNTPCRNERQDIMESKR